MMRKNIFATFLIFSMLSPACIFAQLKFLPTIIALYPREMKVDSIASIELNNYRQSGIVTEQLRKQFLRDGLAPNWKMIREKELAFMDEQDFNTLFLLSLTRELAYIEIENRPSLLIYPLRINNDNSPAFYRRLADEHKVSWIIDVIRTEAICQDDKRVLKITIQLFNVVTNRILLDKQYISDSVTATPTDTCSDSWLCMAERIQKTAAVDITDKVEKNIRYERN
jgi:hypothetical protein